MPKENIIVGLDLGTSQVRTVIAQIQPESYKLLVLGVGVAPSVGISGGSIVDLEETVMAIQRSREDAERIAGVPVESAFVNVGGRHMQVQFSKGVVAVSRADGEIGEEDVARVLAAAQAVSVPSNKEIINVIPCGYAVDGQEQIKNPVGMNGIRLEVNTLLVEGSAPYVKNLERCLVQRCGIEINDMVFSALAAAKAVLTRRQKELGVVLIDVGKETTGYAVYEDGNILGAGVIPVGAGHITNDIAIGLRISIDAAERVKLAYGHTVPEEVDEDEAVDVGEVFEGEEGVFSRRSIVEIIEARVEEIFSMVDDELRKLDKSGMLPSGVVMVGGGAKMPGMVSLSKRILRLPSQIGYPVEMNGVVDKTDDPAFATVMGLMLWDADDNGVFLNQRESSLDLGEVGKKVKGLLKNFLP